MACGAKADGTSPLLLERASFARRSRLPAGSFIGGFPSLPLYRVDRSRRAAHPKPFPKAVIRQCAAIRSTLPTVWEIGRQGLIQLEARLL